MAASTAIPRPPNQTPSVPLSAIPSARLTTSKGRKSSLPSAIAYPTRPGSSASVASSVRGARLSAGLGSATSRGVSTRNQARQLVNGIAVSSQPSDLSAGMRKKVSIAAFPQPPNSAAATQRATSYSVADPSGRSIGPSSRPSIGVRTTSRVLNGRTSLGRSTSASTTPTLSSKTSDFHDFTPSSTPPAASPTLESQTRMSSPTKRSDSDSMARHKESKGNVIVSVRVRPDVGSPTGEPGKTGADWAVDGRKAVVSYKGKDGGDHRYDNVFTASDVNSRVYEAAAKRLVRRVMEGYHGTVFAYGMTGTGKTFSMQGTASSPGVIPLAITDIFAFIRETDHREFLLRVSYLEIYNEKIYDLLSAGQAAGPAGSTEEIKLREDARRGVYASPLKEEIVQSPTQLLRVIARGDSARRTAGTQFNSRSSRSHAVVQIVVESRERANGGGADSRRAGMVPGGVRVSTLSLIDLAGSERAAENKERRTEGAHINKSLLTLGTVIARLSEKKGGPGKDDGAKHLPYRDSKLTRLLQPALSGNSLVSILCTIHLSSGAGSSAITHVNETINTLKFASRARNNIISNAKRSEEAVPGDPTSRALLDRYRMEIIDLRRQLEEQKELSSRAGSARNSGRPASLDGLVDEIDPEKERERMRREDEDNQRRHEEQMLEMQLARTALKERIEHLNRLILSSKSLGVNTFLPFDRSQSSLSVRNQSAISLAGRGTSRLSGTSLALSICRPSSTVDSVHPGSPGMSGMPYSPVLPSGRDRSPRRRDSGRPVSTTPSTDSLGSNGDGTASVSAQVLALQADLADRNRYIDTLERRLVQARRSSQTKGIGHTASTVCPACREGAGPGVDALLRDKDDEIRDLKARLDDKDRMCTVLRSAARRGLAVDSIGSMGSGPSLAMSNTSSPPNMPLPPLMMNRDSISSIASVPSRRTSGLRLVKTGSRPSPSGAVFGSTFGKKVSFPAGSPADSTPSSPSRGVDQISRLLDQMLTERRRGQVTSTASLPVPLLSRPASRLADEVAVSTRAGDVSPRPTSLPAAPEAGSAGAKEDRIDSGIVMKT